MSGSPTGTKSPGAPPGPYARYVLLTLLAVYMVHHLDRVAISLLLEPIGREFRLTDSERGFLAGMGYAIPFAIAGIPLGMLIDRINRVRLLASLLCVWSGLTALCAAAPGFGWLLAARIGVGAAESGGTPANVSIIADYVPPSRRSGAFGVYYMGPHLGTIIGFAVTGAVATAYGWRAAFLVVGVPGLLLALLVVKTIREPLRSADSGTVTAGETAPALTNVLRSIRRTGAAPHFFVGATLINVVAAGLFSWLAPFMIRAHGLSVRDVGFAIAFGMAPFAAVGSLCGGALSDRLGGFRSPRAALLLAAAALITVPAVWIALLTPYTSVLIGALAVQQFAHASTLGPSYAAVLGLLPARMRGASAALMQVAANVLGFGAAVQVIGLLSDGLRGHFTRRRRTRNPALALTRAASGRALRPAQIAGEARDDAVQGDRQVHIEGEIGQLRQQLHQVRMARGIVPKTPCDHLLVNHLHGAGMWPVIEQGHRMNEE